MRDALTIVILLLCGLGIWIVVEPADAGATFNTFYWHLINGR